MTVPFVDLKAEYEICRDEIDANMREVVENTAFIGGAMVKDFEKEMAAHQGAERVVSTGCGTSALAITLQALGVGAGDEVITTPCTAIPTPEAVTLAGAKVVFADIVGGGNYNIDPEKIAQAITPKTRAIIPVHLYGIPCDMDAIMKLAGEKGLIVLEDCAQAQGAKWEGIRVGCLGEAGCFSFFPSKNLGAFGDGGAMCARDEEVCARAHMIANHGKKSKFEHMIEGCNSRLDGVQAAVLRPKLKLLDERNAMRRQVAQWYFEELSGVGGITLPHVPEKAEPIWHIFPVRVKSRDSFCAKLKEKGIATGLHYAMALHLQPAYAHLGLQRGSLPQAEAAFDEEVSLPMFPAMTREQVAEVAGAIREIL